MTRRATAKPTGPKSKGFESLGSPEGYITKAALELGIDDIVEIPLDAYKGLKIRVRPLTDLELSNVLATAKQKGWDSILDRKLLKDVRESGDISIIGKATELMIEIAKLGIDRNPETSPFQADITDEQIEKMRGFSSLMIGVEVLSHTLKGLEGIEDFSKPLKGDSSEPPSAEATDSGKTSES